MVASFSVTDGASTVTGDARLKDSDATTFASAGTSSESQCISWVKDALGEDLVAVYEAKIAEQTSAVEPEVVPLPWINN